MWRLTTPLSVGLLAILLTGCGGSSSSGGSSSAPSSADPRLTAIQKALDARPARARVVSGQICNATYDRKTPTVIEELKHVAQAHVKATLRTTKFSTSHCWFVAWDASAGVKPPAPASHDYVGTDVDDVVVGRQIVDKVGEDSQQMGTTMTSFRAHFEPTPLGKSLASAGIVGFPSATKDITDGQAILHKDAAGNWVAQL